jgi:hypothetical protein
MSAAAQQLLVGCQTEGTPMQTNPKRLIGSLLGVAAAVIASTGLLTAPTAHAAGNCAVAGPRLDIHHSSGYDVSVDANGSSLGPNAVVRSPGETTTWSVSANSSNGRNLDFMIVYPGSKAYVHFTGTVGNDGVAHGTSTEIGSPVQLAAGPWDSVTRFTC